MIKRANLQEVQLFDFFQVITNIDNHLKKADLETLKLKVVYDSDFVPAYASLDTAIEPVQNKAVTRKVWDTDKDRDQVLTGLRRHLKAQSSHPDPEVTEAGSALLEILNKYGKNIQRKALREETGIITNILQEYAKPENAPLVTLTNTNAWTDSLGSFNSELEAIFNDRTRAEALTEVGRAKAARHTMQRAFSKLVKTINSLAFIGGEAPYQALMDNINQEVKQAMTTVLLRKAAKEPKKTSK
ncbi:MAG TPA: hypothetical protein DDZ96_02630 [Porphyromonadaceae bacterium]|jgi:hypothetical protein|nr:hypothetical protein [Porphyromonadaceae bacterium]HBL32702.1 hypothetical protein [Porphyromonadaceae bacterium]HCM21460.1 hypothetical protein [Porphyromonadaceae bacterium]